MTILWAIVVAGLLTGLVQAVRRLGRINDQAEQRPDRPILFLGG